MKLKRAQMPNNSQDIVSDIQPSNLVICGFFTPDYRHSAASLAKDLAPDFRATYSHRSM